MSSTEVQAGAIRLEDVSKRYPGARHTSILHALNHAPKVEHWGLRATDLVIEPGESVGVLGHNGAGKTTFLRLLAGVTRPSTGHIVVHGTVAPLISVGVGFHQELSGRENVLLNGQLLGLARAEVERDLPSILEFSELEESVLDTPVKFYSSGMLLRLAFSVLIHLEADVMLVDEILAVGDLSFQAKCIRRLRAAWAGGTTVVLVSHSPHVIRALCARAIVLHHGRIAFDGPSEQAVWAYNELLGQDEAGGPRTPAVELGEATITSARGEVVTSLELGQTYRLRHHLRFTSAVASPQVFFNVFDETGELVYQRLSTVGQTHQSYTAGEETELDITFTAGIGVGRYRLATEVRSLDGRTVLSRDEGGLTVERTGDPTARGSAELTASIVVDGQVCEPLRVDRPPTRF